MAAADERPLIGRDELDDADPPPLLDQDRGDRHRDKRGEPPGRTEPGAAMSQVTANAGRTRYACRNLVLNAEPDEDAGEHEPAKSAASRAHGSAPTRAATSRNVSSASGLL